MTNQPKPTADSPAPSLHEPAPRVAGSVLLSRLDRVWDCLQQVAPAPSRAGERLRHLRVASRRASTAIDLFAELGCAKATKQMARNVKRIRRAAGRIRDLDVLESLQASSIGTSEPLAQKIADARSKAEGRFAKTVRKLETDERWKNHTSHLSNSFADHGNTTSDDQRSFESWGRQMLSQSSTTFLDAWPEFQHTSEDDFQALHDFRLDVKRMRYRLELLEAAAKDPSIAKEARARLKTCQRALGKITDEDASIQRIHKWREEDLDLNLDVELETRKAARQDALRALSTSWSPKHHEVMRQTLECLIG